MAAKQEEQRLRKDGEHHAADTADEALGDLEGMVKAHHSFNRRKEI